MSDFSEYVNPDNGMLWIDLGLHSTKGSVIAHLSFGHTDSGPRLCLKRGECEFSFLFPSVEDARAAATALTTACDYIESLRKPLQAEAPTAPAPIESDDLPF